MQGRVADGESLCAEPLFRIAVGHPEGLLGFWVLMASEASQVGSGNRAGCGSIPTRASHLSNAFARIQESCEEDCCTLGGLGVSV